MSINTGIEPAYRFTVRHWSLRCSCGILSSIGREKGNRYQRVNDRNRLRMSIDLFYSHLFRGSGIFLLCSRSEGCFSMKFVIYTIGIWFSVETLFFFFQFKLIKRFRVIQFPSRDRSRRHAIYGFGWVTRYKWSVQSLTLFLLTTLESRRLACLFECVL